MTKHRRKYWEIAIRMKTSSKNDNIDRLRKLINKPVDIMQNKAGNEFNPWGHKLSDEANRLKTI